MSKVNEENETTTNESGKEETKKFLLSDESFNLLRSSQEKIKQETDMIPSLRKLVNSLMSPEAVKQLTQRLIEQYK